MTYTLSQHHSLSLPLPLPHPLSASLTLSSSSSAHPLSASTHSLFLPPHLSLLAAHEHSPHSLWRCCCFIALPFGFLCLSSSHSGSPVLYLFLFVSVSLAFSVLIALTLSFSLSFFSVFSLSLPPSLLAGRGLTQGGERPGRNSTAQWVSAGCRQMGDDSRKIPFQATSCKQSAIQKRERESE